MGEPDYERNLKTLGPVYDRGRNFRRVSRNDGPLIPKCEQTSLVQLLISKRTYRSKQTQANLPGESRRFGHRTNSFSRHNPVALEYGIKLVRGEVAKGFDAPGGPADFHLVNLLGRA
jgi:hypothetical protein